MSAALRSFAWLAWSWTTIAGVAPSVRAQETVPVAPVAAAAPGADPEARCADCHAEIVESYAKTGMANALRSLDGIDLSGLEPVPDAKTGFRYRFEGSGASARIVEQWFDRDGNLRPETRLEVPLKFAIGAGIFDTAFAAELGGQWWFAPLELISAHDGVERHAQLAPKHMHKPGVRFTSPVPDDCLACHTERLPERTYPPSAVPTKPWTPRGIGCAGCHTGGPEHVAWRDAELEGETPPGEDPLLAPSRLSVEQRVSLCTRCHMQGDARVTLEPGLVGLPPPGCDLLEANAVFIGAGDTDEIGFVSAGERMLESQCFEESFRSAKPMTCESCHDPHRTLYDPVERQRVRAACSRCHVADGAPPPGRSAACSLPFDDRGANDCVDCHMRKTPVFDVWGVRIHDHRIVRELTPPSSYKRTRATQAGGGPIARVHWPGTTPPLADDRGVEMIALASIGQVSAAVKLVDSPTAASNEATLPYRFTRANLLAGLGRLEDARTSYLAARAIAPDEPAVVINLTDVLNRLGRHRESTELLDALLARHPRAESGLLNRANARAALGELAAARADLEAYLAIRPRADVARSLAELCRALGDIDASRSWSAAAARFDPRK
ncbi:MAG: hypothetical protein L6Q99_18520 [Planctomycetes bacterium]|nr:hypothetical protein [Planctomycetota bacterium]